MYLLFIFIIIFPFLHTIIIQYENIKFLFYLLFSIPSDILCVGTIFVGIMGNMVFGKMDY